MDSATTAAIASSRGFEVVALSFRYGQRHAVELEAARGIVEQLKLARHLVVDIDLAPIGGSALTTEIAVPKDRQIEEIGRGIPPTYVPARNTIFLSFALAVAEVVGADDIFIGANALDYSGYPDCRPEYFRAFQAMADLATRAGVEEGRRIRINAPLLELTKAEIIGRGRELGVDYGVTLSCYDPCPEGAACGRCDACLLRLKGFRESGIEDPAPYQAAADRREI
jgi:7-cyano-7-deazaguanine synthase